MITVINQEAYKLLHKKITWLAPFLIVLLMIPFIMSFDDAISAPWLVMSSFGIDEIAPLIMILVAATFFSSEFKQRTILTMLAKTPSRKDVYLAKLTVVGLCDVVIHGLAIIMTLILNYALPKFRLDLFKPYLYHQSLLTNVLTMTLVDILVTMFLVSILFLISCSITENAVVLAISLGVFFMGQIVPPGIQFLPQQYLHWLRWNPLNMMLLPLQYANYPVYHDMSHLSTLQLGVATAGYAIVFAVLGYQIFRRRHY